ncbi:MAG: HD domain-containing phosphohydrolase [Phycisphaerae bacterium]
MDSSPNGKILVVEDEADLRFLLCAHLAAEGFETREACDGIDALSMAHEFAPDLIIMDVGLPRMDGVSATAALKADVKTAYIPVIMLTARSTTNDIIRGLDAGAQEYLAKPFDMGELLARVKTVHNLASAHRDLDRLNQSLEAQVDVKTKRLQLLYDFVRNLNKANNRDVILEKTVEAVGQLTQAKRISILIKDSHGENLICERAVGIDPEIVSQISIRPVEGIAGQVFSSGKTVAAMAISNEPTEENGKSEPFLSTPLVSTSLQSEDGVLGVLNITEKLECSAFSKEEIECVQSIADAAAIALNNVQRRERLEESVKVLIRTVGHLAEYRDEETTRHLERVSIMSGILSETMMREGIYGDQVNNRFVDMIVQAAPMHDIGKVGIPDEILTKPGSLTNEEFDVMKTHTVIGQRVLSKAFDPMNPMPLLSMCIDIAYCHHERFDGNGYPRGLKGQAIPLAARIIAVVDAYDAITSHRRYSKAKDHEEAVSIIQNDAGKHFDPEVVRAFDLSQEQFRRIGQKFGEQMTAIEAT